MTNSADQSLKGIPSIGESASGYNQPSKEEPGPSGRNLRARIKNHVKDPEHPAQDSKKPKNQSAVADVIKEKKEPKTRPTRGQKKAAEKEKPVKESIPAVIAEPQLPKTSARTTKSAAKVEKKVEAAEPKPAATMRTRAKVNKVADVIPEPQPVAKPKSSAPMKPTVAKKTRGGRNEADDEAHMKDCAVRLEPLSKKTVSELPAKESRSEKVGRGRPKRALPDDQTSKDGQSESSGSTRKKQKETTTKRPATTRSVQERKSTLDAAKAKSTTTTSSTEPAPLLQRKSKLAANKLIHKKVEQETKENQSPNSEPRKSAKVLPTGTIPPRKISVSQNEQVKKQQKSKQVKSAKKQEVDTKEEPAKKQRTVEEQKALKPHKPMPVANSTKTVITQVKAPQTDSQAASTSSATTSAAAASVFPSVPSFKNIDSDNDEDPYSFQASQSEPAGKATKKPPKKREAKLKPGNKMDLLMQKEKLDAVGHSCTFQNNPERYEDERKKLVMQINVPGPTITKLVVADREAPSAGEGSSRYVTAVESLSKLVASDQEIPSAGESSSNFQSFHSKVWHSPRPSAGRSMEDPPEVSFVSDSPPIQSSFAIKMAEAAKQGKAAPFRVTGNLPPAFYMGVSNDDGTPSFSSDVIDQEKHLVSAAKSDSSRNSASTSIASRNSGQGSSMLADSNAENMAPSGFVNSPVRKPRNALSIRSPLKALPAQSLDASMADDAQDAFGFDELIDEDGAAESSPGPSMPTDNFRGILKNLKKDLPSKVNRGRVKALQSPVKKVNLMGSPSKPTSLRKFLSSSTPLGNGPRTSSQFGNTSEIVGTGGTAESTTSADDSNVGLFSESSEVPKVSLTNFSFISFSTTYFAGTTQLRATQARRQISPDGRRI